jgi:hypothetical protein
MTSQPQFLCFDPWIGKHYWDQPFMGKRILIVEGDFWLHRGAPTTPAHLHLTTGSTRTTRLIEEHYSSDLNPAVRFYPRRRVSATRIRAVWESLALYEFQQADRWAISLAEAETMMSGFRDRLRKTIQQLRPEVIAIRGFLLEDVFVEPTVHVEHFEFPKDRWSTVCTLKRIQFHHGSALVFAAFGNQDTWREMIRLAVRRSS